MSRPSGQIDQFAIDEPNALLARSDSLGYLVNHLARQFAIALRDELAPYGVGSGQFAQLLALYEQDGLTQTQLCELVQIEQPTMANTLKRMQRDGLITPRSTIPTTAVAS